MAPRNASKSDSSSWQPGQPVGNTRISVEPSRQAQYDKTFLAMAVADPLRFCKMCWPKMALYDKQAATILSVRDNKQTYVHAAHAMGKSRLAAITAIWWFCSRSPSRVIATSSSEKQLRQVLWSEIRLLLEESAVKLPLEVTDLNVRKLNPAFPTGSSEQYLPGQYLIGQVAGQVESFQGHHLPNDRPRVLLIFEEASSIADEFKVAGDSWAHHELIIGNPINVNNFFYRDCKQGDAPDPSGEAKLGRKIIHIDGADSPNVKLGMKLAERGHKGPWPLAIPGLLSYPEWLMRLQTWDEVQIHSRLRGLFYEGADALLFPMAWLDLAQNHWRMIIAANEILRRAGGVVPKRIGRAIGIDVAMGGRDDTVWTLIDGKGIIEQIVKDTPNTMEIAGKTIQLMQEHAIPPGNVAIDLGGGKSIFDRLAEQGYHINGINFGGAAGEWAKDPKKAAAAKKTYRNLRAEMYGILREFLDPANCAESNSQFAIPDSYHLLREELAVLPLTYDSDGRLRLPPKDRDSGSAKGGTKREKTIKELLGRSPDRADSLVLATWAARNGVATQYWAVADVKAAANIETKSLAMAMEMEAKVKEMMRKMEALGGMAGGGAWGGLRAGRYVAEKAFKTTPPFPLARD